MRANFKDRAGFVWIPLVMGLGGGWLGGMIGGGAIAGVGFSAMFGMTGTQIGAALGMIAGSTLGSILFPAKHEDNLPALSNYPLQMSIKGTPVQKVFGTLVIAGNVTWEGEMTPYQIRHETGGGKGGGAEVASYETRYRQSFLVDLGEGPMSVIRIMADNKEIWPSPSEGHPGRTLKVGGGGTPADITVFEGIDNQGIKDLTGEDYGEWPHNCCVFFTDYELGNTQTKPNLTFEVGAGINPYFIGAHYTIGTDKKIVWKVRSDGSLDTTWGDAGTWHYTSGFGGTVTANDMYLMSDGRLLVAHNPFWIENGSLPSGKLVGCTMLTAAGAIDTSWGYNGHFVLRQTGADYSIASILKLLTDEDGNFYICGETGYEFQKFDANGTRVFATAPHANLHDMCWADDAKTRIIAVGQTENPPGAPVEIANCIALDPQTGLVDPDWPGNLTAHPGYAFIEPPNNTVPLFCDAIRRVSDGFVTLHGLGNSGDYYSCSKINLSGSAYVAGWGTAGHVKAGWPNYKGRSMAQEGDLIWTLTENNAEGAPVGTDNSLRCWDDDGNVIHSQDWDGSLDPYLTFTLTAGNLILGTQKTAPAQYYIEYWSRNGSYISGFDPAGFAGDIFCIVPIGPFEALDMNFATMCREVVTDTRWGAGFTGLINEASFAAVEDYCGAKGFLGSLVLKERKSWRDWLDYICSHFGGYYRESGGQLYLGVFRDEDAVAALTLEDFVIEEAEGPPPPIQIKERDYSESFNQVRISWTDRENDYVVASLIARDEVDQRISGQVREKFYDLQGIMNRPLAVRMAYQLLMEALHRINIYTATITFKNMLLEQGDVITISDGAQIAAQKVRILSIDEDVNGRGLALTMVDDLAYLYPDVDFESQENLRPPVTEITLADAMIHFREDIDASRLYLSIAPANQYANGWYIYKSYDDVSYQLVGRCGLDGITGGSANSTGTISGFLPAHPAVTWAINESVLVSIGTVTDLHTDITDDQFWNGRRLARIGDEIIAFKDAVETATPGIWQISNLRRGLFGTEPVAHYAGETFCTLDVDFTYVFTESDVGQTLYFKALTFYGSAIQSIADVSGFDIMIQGYAARPAAAACLRLAADIMDGGSGDYSGASFTLYWNLGARASGLGVGGHDVNPAHPSWFYPDAESLLVASGGALFGNYLQDTELQKVVLRFEQTNGTLIGEREIAVAEQATITKATDLGGNNPAVIKVIPRRALRAWDENEITVDDGT